MTDSFFNRQFLFVVVFLSTFALLGGLIPIEITAPLQKRGVTPRDEWLSADLLNYYETWSQNLNTSEYKGHNTLSHEYYRDVDIGNHDFDIYWSEPNYSNPIAPDEDHYIKIHHWYAHFFLFPATHHRMQFYNDQRINRGHLLTCTEIDLDFVNSTLSARYEPECNHFGVTIYVNYNTTKYANATDAFDHNGINVFIGIGFEDVGTSFNAWSLINPVLFFQTPSTLNLINLIISIPIWLSAIYIAITIILWFIPFMSKG